MIDRTNVLRCANSILLLVIAIILLLILRAMPEPGPTQADIDKAANDPRLQAKLRGKMPKIAIEGTVEVSSDMNDPIYIQTDPTGGHPLQIDR